jgi:murein endopeptidase
MWPLLPTGRRRVASGTLLPVIRSAAPRPVARLRHPLVLLVVAALTVIPGAAPARPAPVATGVPVARDTGVAAETGSRERGRPPEAAINWRRSRALGRPNHGRLTRGVGLPATGTHFVTVDPVTGTIPNRAWRRTGTDRLVRLLLRVAEEHAAAHPDAPRLVVGDLSRPRGGRFGPELGGDGHRSHQNGLDADVFYPRRDGRERIPARVGQVDRRLAQELVDRFVRAGAQYVFVGPATGLRGPAKVVMALANHDDHLHVRIRPAARARR